MEIIKAKNGMTLDVKVLGRLDTNTAPELDENIKNDINIDNNYKNTEKDKNNSNDDTINENEIRHDCSCLIVRNDYALRA